MAKVYGTLSTSNAANATITANLNRLFLRIYNLDAAINIFANFGTAAVANQTHIIKAGTYVDFEFNKFPEITNQLNLIAASGTPAYIAVDNI